MFFIDQGVFANRDKDKYPDDTVDYKNYPPENLQITSVRSYVSLAILLYLSCLVIEWVLFCKAMTVKATSLQDENLNSEDVKLEVESNDELNKRMTTYKDVKTGKKKIVKNNRGSGVIEDDDDV